MKGKFTTTSSSLFNNNNSEQIPDWLNNIEFEIKEREEIELNFKPKGAFADKQIVYRDEKDGVPREVSANFTNNKLLTDAKVHLARFLAGKYYKVEATATYSSVILNTIIDGVPANFRFAYAVDGNRLKNNQTFEVIFNEEECEYPFSKAGFNECLADIKNNKVRTSQKVESVGKYSIINREEIIRRYNGKLREATDKINELLSEGSLIGVGSNSYASFYDVDYLFPQLEKEHELPEKLAEFHFAPNIEHVATAEFKSAKALSVEASKVLSQLFKDYVVLSKLRNNDELLMEIDILSNSGIRKKACFNFGIENEKLASLKLVKSDDNLMTLEQFLNKLDINNSVLGAYLSNNQDTVKRIYRGVVLAKQTIVQRLEKIIRRDIIDDVINNWMDRQLIAPVSSTTFTTELTFEELLSNINTKLLTSDEINEINDLSNKAAMYITNRQDVEGTGVRQTEELVSDDTLLNAANKFLSKFFKDFQAVGFEVKDETINYSIRLFDEDTGLSTVVNMSMAIDGNKIIECHANINDEKVNINNIKQAFVMNEALNRYLETNPGKRTDAPMIMTVANLKNKLTTFAKASLNEIDEIIDTWEKNGKISKLGVNVFASKYTFEQLISMSNIKPLTDNELKEKIAKSQRDRNMVISSNHIKNNDTRLLVETWSPDKMMLYAKKELNQIFKDYDILDVEITNKSYDIVARAVNPSTGIRQKFTCKFAMVNDRPTNLLNISTNDCDSMEINVFLQHNNVNKRNYKNLISKTQLKNKLASVIDVNDIDSLTKSLVESQILIPTNMATFASDYSMSEIVAHLAKFNLTNINIARNNQELAKRDEHIIKISDTRIMDNDTRKIVLIEKGLSPEMIKLKDKITETAKKAHSQKIITTNKFNQIDDMLNNAKDEKDLDATWKELKKYFV